MTATEKIKRFILQNPDASNEQAATACNNTKNFVSKCRAELRKEGRLPPAPEDYRRKQGENYHTLPEATKGEENITGRLKALFKRKDVQTFEDLSNQLDCGIGKVKQLIGELVSQGHNFKVNGETIIFSHLIEKSESRVMDVEKMSTGFYRFGVTGDNHLCSRYERLDVLNNLYDLFAGEGITRVFNTGNWIDGEARFNKHDLKVHGLDNQINYFLENYPQRKGVQTDYITGDDHEGWYTQREGINVGMYAENKARKAGREDLGFLGHMEADVILKASQGETILRVLHPGGGSAYAISYTSQKIVESYSSGEKPHILLDGHYHKAGYNYIRGVHVVQTGCTQDQTPFMRKKRLAAHLGGWIIEFSVDDQGAITRFKQEFIPFYDNGYYTKWGYQWK
jgi:hypothetical protein